VAHALQPACLVQGIEGARVDAERNGPRGTEDPPVLLKERLCLAPCLRLFHGGLKYHQLFIYVNLFILSEDRYGLPMTTLATGNSG